MGDVLPLHREPPRHWLPAGTEDIRRLPLPFELGDVLLNCAHDGCHLDRVTQNETLMRIWPWMRESLLYIKRRNSPTSHWLPEHVRVEIQKGFVGQNAVECFVGHDAKADVLQGFMVCYPLVDPFVNLPLVWHVWMASIAIEGFDGIYLRDFERLATERGYRHWQFGSSRRAWERRAARFGMQVFERTIRKEIL